jgi:hypothetical protein
LRLSSSEEVGVHAAEFALRVNVIFLLLGKVQENLPLGDIHLNIANHAINIYVSTSIFGKTWFRMLATPATQANFWRLPRTLTLLPAPVR